MSFHRLQRSLSWGIAIATLSPLLLLGVGRAADSPDAVVVTINGEPLRESQVRAAADQIINANIARDRQNGLIFEESARAGMRDFMRENVLHTLMERILIQQQLKKDRIEITDAEVDAQFLKKAAQLKQTPAEAEQQIAAEGKTLRDVKERIRWHNLGIEKLYTAHAASKKVLTEAEAWQMYSDYPGEYDRPEERRVSYILITVPRNGDSATKAEARKRAEALLVRIQAGEDFATLARTYSDDAASRGRGGDRGFSKRGIVVKPEDDPFGTAAFALQKVGDVSGVVADNAGFNIIKLTGLKPARRLSFDEVKTDLMEDFRHREIGDFWEVYGGNLWSQATVKWTPAEMERKARITKEQAEESRRIDAEIAKQQQADADNAARQQLELVVPPVIETAPAGQKP